MFSRQGVLQVPDVLHQGSVKDSVWGKLQQGGSQMTHTSGTNSCCFLLFLKASAVFTLSITLGSFVHEQFCNTFMKYDMLLYQLKTVINISSEEM